MLTETGVAHELWSVPEVVELVLLQLPMLDLLLSQQVCSEWRRLISTAPSLQRALFIEARNLPSSCASDGLESLTSDLEVNPLLIKLFAHWFPRDAECPISNGPIHAGDLLGSMRWSETFRHKLLRQGASWRRMLLTQPPMRIYEHVVCPLPTVQTPFNDIFIGTRIFKDGIRMGFVHDRALASFSWTNGGFYTITNAGPEAWGAVRRGCKYMLERLDRPTTGPVAESRFFGGRDKYTMVTTKFGGFRGYSDTDNRRLVLEKYVCADYEHWETPSTKSEGKWEKCGHFQVRGEARTFRTALGAPPHHGEG